MAGALLLLVTAGPAIAHRPYFKQAGAVRLPDGRTVELRLLYGDGFIAPDPVRPVLLDAQGRILALGPHGETLSLLRGRASDDLTVFDHGSWTVLVPDPAGFQAGEPFVPGNGDDYDPL